LKVLPDTSVWSLSLRRKASAALSRDQIRLKDSLTEAIGDGRVVIIGPIRQELLSGIKDRSQFERLKHTLRSFVDEPLDRRDYEEAAYFYNLCRSRGVECGAIDILICSVAIRRDWLILAHDEALNRCFKIVQSAAS
jgi:predicted nucleic acid-binding protein